jgi:putative acetyltransferase
VRLRRCEPADGPATLAVFLRAVRITAAASYRPDQIAAWAPRELEDEVDGWSARQSERNAVVAEIDEAIVGFSDVDESGYIDMLFVDPDHNRRGVATALLGWVVAEAARLGAARLTTCASETARPFFRKHGFSEDEHRMFELCGTDMTNWAMSRPTNA